MQFIVAGTHGAGGAKDTGQTMSGLKFHFRGLDFAEFCNGLKIQGQVLHTRLFTG